MTNTPDPHGQAALMLCESLMLLLVEQGLVGRNLMVGMVENVVDLSQGAGGIDGRASVGMTPVGLLRGITTSLLALPRPSLIDGVAHSRTLL